MLSATLQNAKRDGVSHTCDGKMRQVQCKKPITVHLRICTPEIQARKTIFEKIPSDFRALMTEKHF